MTDLILNHDGNDNYNVTLQNVPLIGVFIITITAPSSYQINLNSKRYFIYKNVNDVNGNVYSLTNSSYFAPFNLNCE